MQRTRRMLLLAGVLALAGCVAPGPRTTTISQEKLQTLLATRFPYTGKLGALFELQAQAPQVRLMPEQNRIGTSIQVQVSDRLGRASFNGLLDVDYGVRFEPSDQSIRMADVHVNSFTFSGVPERYQAIVQDYAQQLAGRMLSDVSLHQIRAKDMETIKGWGYEPGAIDVTPEGLRITLQPRQQP
ncbi:DUF1439 domain-containing protein [Rhodoferax sp. OV413]|uniref:DUF1439 domain-containing protein n=1 Tax=Rhodoferax sp. OV413 TaxID=1855285 RepID=UPI000B82ABAE|nr:DUF1439 domain-containing protein [Rhodoferax sp. OV413]